jgi:Mn2+/Fe2+ NRAMP family transporter
VCEGLGFESGVDKRFNEAPAFYWLFTMLVVLGAGVILWPNFPLVKMILWSQVLNGVLLPVVLIYMVMLINKKSLMKDWTNSHIYNAVAWVAVVIMIGLTLALASISVKQMTQPAGASTEPQSRPLADMQRHDAGGHSFKANVSEAGGAHLLR